MQVLVIIAITLALFAAAFSLLPHFQVHLINQGKMALQFSHMCNNFDEELLALT